MNEYRQRCADAAMKAWSMHAVVCDHSQTIPVGNLVDAVLAVESEVIADLNDLITQERTIHEQTIQEVARLRAESADLRAAVGRDIVIIGRLRQQLDAAQATRDETHVWTNTDWKERAEQAAAVIARVRADCEAQKAANGAHASRDSTRGGIYAQAARTLNMLATL